MPKLYLKNVNLSGDVVLIEGQSGGSIVGITPGAALEKKSVRDMAAGLNRLGGRCNIFLPFTHLNFNLA